MNFQRTLADALTAMHEHDRVRAGSDFTLLKAITTFNHGANADGLIVVGGAGGTIENLTSFNNRYGLFAGSVTTLNVNGADLFYNSATGLRQDGGTTGTWDAVQTHGNATGFEIGGTITITNARVFENVGTGVSSGGTATVQTSEIFGNATGIVLNNGSISASRIYGNVGTGVVLVLPKGMQLFLSFRALVGYDDRQAYTANGGLRIGF